jgi:hypothetical protein
MSRSIHQSGTKVPEGANRYEVLRHRPESRRWRSAVLALAGSSAALASSHREAPPSQNPETRRNRFLRVQQLQRRAVTATSRSSRTTSPGGRLRRPQLFHARPRRRLRHQNRQQRRRPGGDLTFRFQFEIKRKNIALTIGPGQSADGGDSAHPGRRDRRGDDSALNVKQGVAHPPVVRTDSRARRTPAA